MVFRAHLGRAQSKLLAASLVLAVLTPGVAASQDTAPLDEEYLQQRLEGDAILAEQRAVAEANGSELSAASAELQSLTANAAALEAEIAALDVQIAEARALYDEELAAQADAIKSQFDLELRIDDARLELDAWDALITERAVAAYIRPVRTPTIVPILQSGSLTELQRKMALLDAVVENDTVLVDGLEAARAVLDEELLEQEYVEAKAEESRRRADEARAELDAAQQEQRALKAQLDAQVEAFRAEVDALAAAQAELDRIIASREARFVAEAQQRAAWRADCAGGLTPVNDNGLVVDCGSLDDPAAPSSLGWPSGGVVSSEYGSRWGRVHQGLDIAGPTGAFIAAAEDGIVFFAGWLGGYGNTVMIDHGGGILTLYGHLDSIWVGEGGRVGRGEGVAAMGSTGNSTGPHLHFEVRVNGAPVDPRQYLG